MSQPADDLRFPVRASTAPTPGPAQDDGRRGKTQSERRLRSPLSVEGLGALKEIPNPEARRVSRQHTSVSDRQQRGRSNTVRAYHPPTRPNWQPGAEPGVDTTKDPAPYEHQFHEKCEITVVDFSEQQLEEHTLGNDSLESFLEKPREDWVACRWICVNGLDYDVIKLLSNYKGLHGLAIEDLMNRRNRTKADWYTDHCFIILSLQKLVYLNPYLFDDSSDEDDGVEQANDIYEHRRKKKSGFLKQFFAPKNKRHRRSGPSEFIQEGDFKLREVNSSGSRSSICGSARSFRTLQQYRGGADVERVDYMERKSALTAKNLAVSVEQVAIFLCEDGSIISFFEHSASDVFNPIFERLSTPDTILRRSCDASMMLQAIIDAIIDLAIPVISAYDAVIGELELEVLTDPDMKQPKELYILTSELSLVRSNIQGIPGLVNALRDHKPEPIGTPGAGIRPTRLQPSTISISPVTHPYLGDVEDHSLMILQSLSHMQTSCENLTSLLFNMMSAFTNETVKQLTFVTILFLPLTFLVGYFGQNFQRFDAIKYNSDAFFWYVATPTTIVTALYLFRGVILRFFARVYSKRHISISRKQRLAAERTARANYLKTISGSTNSTRAPVASVVA